MLLLAAVNSRAIARKQYLQVTEEHFERAAGLSMGKDEAVQNPTQQMSESYRMASHPKSQSVKYDKKRSLATQCKAPVGDAGFEPATG